MQMDSSIETVTEEGRLLLHLTYCAFKRNVGEEKSVMSLQEQKRKM
jgi:hypothetical protein